MFGKPRHSDLTPTERQRTSDKWSTSKRTIRLSAFFAIRCILRVNVRNAIIHHQVSNVQPLIDDSTASAQHLDDFPDTRHVPATMTSRQTALVLGRVSLCALLGALLGTAGAVPAGGQALVSIASLLVRFNTNEGDGEPVRNVTRWLAR